ncbi:hypothetical protein TWF718_005189 [Orbilia javanica]|uniref:Uncharacterized protein n=1 Tax=Orbilia javanica TaxID=47235 RepID=A0AAN8N9F2_9PEZI
MLQDDKFKDVANQGHELVKDIMHHADRINYTGRTFIRYIKKSKTPIFSFYERGLTREVIKIPYTFKEETDKSFRQIMVIVDPETTSAVLELGELEEAHPSDGDHSTIVKLRNPQDRTFTTVRDRITEIIQRAKTVAIPSQLDSSFCGSNDPDESIPSGSSDARPQKRLKLSQQTQG